MNGWLAGGDVHGCVHGSAEEGGGDVEDEDADSDLESTP